MSESGPGDGFLGKISLQMERQNRRMLADLTAWAEILDALGWNVALRRPGLEPVLSARARQWTCTRSEIPMSWQDIIARLAAAPPARRMIDTAQLQVWAEGGMEVACGGEPTPSAPVTKREAEVLAWLREAKTGPEIGIILGCAQRTVESHVARIYRKFGVRHRAQLVFQTDTDIP
jgi:DNA-binding CsgD family transcriptional regulator